MRQKRLCNLSKVRQLLSGTASIISTPAILNFLTIFTTFFMFFAVFSFVPVPTAFGILLSTLELANSHCRHVKVSHWMLYFGAALLVSNFKKIWYVLCIVFYFLELFSSMVFMSLNKISTVVSESVSTNIKSGIFMSIFCCFPWFCVSAYLSPCAGLYTWKIWFPV